MYAWAKRSLCAKSIKHFNGGEEIQLVLSFSVSLFLFLSFADSFSLLHTFQGQGICECVFALRIVQWTLSTYCVTIAIYLTFMPFELKIFVRRSFNNKYTVWNAVLVLLHQYSSNWHPKYFCELIQNHLSMLSEQRHCHESWQRWNYLMFVCSSIYNMCAIIDLIVHWLFIDLNHFFWKKFVDSKNTILHHFFVQFFFKARNLLQF